CVIAVDAGGAMNRKNASNVSPGFSVPVGRGQTICLLLPGFGFGKHVTLVPLNVAVDASYVAESLVTTIDEVCGVLLVPVFFTSRWKPMPRPYDTFGISLVVVPISGSNVNVIPGAA